MRKRKLRFFIRAFLLCFFSLVGIFFLLFFSVRYLANSDYFKIKESEYFFGENIFRVNLQKEAQGLSKRYPYYKRIILRRRMPDRIVIDSQPRKAIARVKLSEYFYVDREGVLFYPAVQEDANLQLPLIVGLDEEIPDPRSGMKYIEKSFLTTLDFIDSLNKDSNLTEQLKIKEINLTNVNDVFLFANTGCKINLGGILSLHKDLSILQNLISEIKSDFSKIEYVDLRFREPVVKYK